MSSIQTTRDPASQQIASTLRAAIRTGRYQPGDRLPSQIELSERYKVARETVKVALRILRDERLLVTRQGSGAYVRAQIERPVGLRPHIEAAFDRTHVTIDFAGYSGETLLGALSEPLDKVRSGRFTPESLRLRLLVPSMHEGSPIPRSVDGNKDAAVKDRQLKIHVRTAEALMAAVLELQELGLVKSASVDVRSYPSTPAFKLYVLNGEEAFFGFYPIVEHSPIVNGKPVPIHDLMGKDSALFYFNSTDEDTYAAFVR